MQWAEEPQSPRSEQEQPTWFAKQRPPVQCRLSPQSAASLHSRAPEVGHSSPRGSATGGGASLQATTRKTTAEPTTIRETFASR